MDLLPTNEELNRLWGQINPKQRFLRAARRAINEACRFDDSMAAFYLDSQDVDLVMEDDAMPYFDEIEDDIINMRRDVNGFRIPAPRCIEYARGTDSVNYRGKTFEYIQDEPDFIVGEKVDRWEDI
jgi:hypothetical protein